MLQSPVLQSIETTLIDVDPIHIAELPITLIATPLGVCVSAEGYGTVDSELGHTCPVAIELRRGRLQVVTWPDINSRQATVIDLSGALESRRRPDRK